MAGIAGIAGIAGMAGIAGIAGISGIGGTDGTAPGAVVARGVAGAVGASSSGGGTTALALLVGSGTGADVRVEPGAAPLVVVVVVLWMRFGLVWWPSPQAAMAGLTASATATVTRIVLRVLECRMVDRSSAT